MKILTEEKDGKLIVSVEVEHIRGTRKTKKVFRTSDVLKALAQRGLTNLRLVKETIIFNYQTLERCRGVWVFEPTTSIELEFVRNNLIKALKIPEEMLEPLTPPKKKRKSRKKKKLGEE